MQKKLTDFTKRLFLLFIITIFITIDQLFKNYVITTTPIIKNFNLMNNFLKIVYVENFGIAFGLIPNFRYGLIFISIVIIFTLIFVLFDKNLVTKIFPNFSLILVISGGMSNLIDRIFRGHVVDNIKLMFFPPVFNLADFFITLGVILISLNSIKKFKKH